VRLRLEAGGNRCELRISPILRGDSGGVPKAFANGKVAMVSVATNRSWIDKLTDDRIEKTDCVTVTNRARQRS
jgi:hypothetical protein